MGDDIYHWNIIGLKCKRSHNYFAKINQINSILESGATSILNLQETHISTENELPNFMTTYSHLFAFETTFSRSGVVSSGIIVCVRKTDTIIYSEVLENGRLIYIKTKNEARNTYKHLFSLCCNPSDATKQKTVNKKTKRQGYN